MGIGGATDGLVQSVRWVEPGCRGDRHGLHLTIGSPELLLYLIYIYIYTLLSEKPLLFICRVAQGFGRAGSSDGSCIYRSSYIGRVVLYSDTHTYKKRHGLS
jgi:hypothetical protein